MIILIAVVALLVTGSLCATLTAAKHVPDSVDYLTKRSSEKDASLQSQVPSEEGQYKYRSTRVPGAMHGKRFRVGFGGVIPYVAARFTETADNSETFAYLGNGLKLLGNAAPAATNDQAIVTKETFVPSARNGAIPAFVCIDLDVEVSNLTDEGWIAGTITSGSAEAYTAPADGIVLAKAKSANTYSVSVYQNTVAAVSLVVTAQDTPVVNVQDAWSLIYEIGTESDGSDTIIEVWQNGKKCAFNNTSAEILAAKLALYTMYATTVPTLCGIFSRRCNGTTQRSSTIKALDWAAD